MKLNWTIQEFYDMTGRMPTDDDLERLNCTGQGEAGHKSCGYCKKHKQPMFMCGCTHYEEY